MYIIWFQLYQRTLKCEQRNKLFGLWYMVFNTTFKNISDISRRSVLLVEETGENRRSVTSHWQTLSHNVVSCTLPWTGLELTTLVMTGTDCTGTCKSNYHAITTTTAPQRTKTNGKLHQLIETIVSFVVFSVRFAIFSVRFIAFSVRFVVFCVRLVLFSIMCIVFSVRFVVCLLRFVVFQSDLWYF